MDTLECNRARGAAALCMGRAPTTSRIALGTKTAFDSDIVFLTAMKAGGPANCQIDWRASPALFFEFVSRQYSPKVPLQTDHY
jgi:hypothetical protein